MVTRSGVIFLLVTIFSISAEERKNFKETVRNCSENFECVRGTTCEHYNQRLAEYKRTYCTEIKEELRATVCNKRNRAVCCRKEEEQVPFPESQDVCGKPQKIPESVILLFLCM